MAVGWTGYESRGISPQMDDRVIIGAPKLKGSGMSLFFFELCLVEVFAAQRRIQVIEGCEPRRCIELRSGFIFERAN